MAKLKWLLITLLLPLTANSQQWDNGYTETQFLEVQDKIKSIYNPIIENRNGHFVIDADWTDGAVNAFAWREGDEYRIEVPGGLTRYHLFNEDAYLLMICHEIGHLVGGEPLSYDISF